MKKAVPKEAALTYLTDLVRDCGADDKDRLKAAEILIKNSPTEQADSEIKVSIEVV